MGGVALLHRVAETAAFHAPEPHIYLTRDAVRLVRVRSSGRPVTLGGSERAGSRAAHLRHALVPRRQ